MYEDILVSVVIPTYARKETLKNAVDCIMQQTHQNLEIIVVDDNPADSKYRPIVEEIMAGYAEDPRVRYIQNPQNLGGAGARNVGIEASTGDYIAFLDDDDIYHPEKIEKQLKVFMESSDEKLALVYCDVAQIDKKGNINYVIRKRFRGNCLYESMSTDCLAPTSLWLVKKAAVVDVDNFTIVPCKQDSTLILKLLVAGYHVDFVPEILVSYANFDIGKKITNYGPKNILGEELYREACRKTFERLTPAQQNHVEFEFSSRFYKMYKFNKMQAETAKARKDMFKYSPARAVEFFLRSWGHSLKHR